MPDIINIIKKNTKGKKLTKKSPKTKKRLTDAFTHH